MFPQDPKSQTLLGRMNAFDPEPGLGGLLHKTKNMVMGVYDFTVSGGNISTIPLVDDQGNPCILPQGAVVTNVVAHTVVAVTSVGLATVALGSNIASATADLMAATAKASLTLGSFNAGAPVGTAATWVGPVTAQAGSQVQATIGTAALTAGKIRFFIEYVVSIAS